MNLPMRRIHLVVFAVLAVVLPAVVAVWGAGGAVLALRTFRWEPRER